MFYWSLALRSGFKAFSLQRKSLRFPVPKRILAVLIMFPVFLLLTLVNRTFMALDWVVFPGFAQTSVRKPVFIIGVARSATTYLFKTLARDKENFTSFKLWEILFAPSIIQKYFWLGVIAIDRKIGRPLKWYANMFDRIFLGKITRVHETGLSKVEEDEMLLLYTFTSVYLTFFFPDLEDMNQVIYFDEYFPEKKKAQVMRYYKRCVQRHMFVFGRIREVRFLSKNPGFISKMDAVGDTFPDAALLYMLRSPYKTIPSTISMNKNVYGIFSDLKYVHLREEVTREVVIRWYEGARKSLEGKWAGKYCVLPFKRVTQEPKKMIGETYHFLGLNPGEEMRTKLEEEQSNVRSYSTEHKYNTKAGIEDEVIRKRLQFILEGEYKDAI